MSKTSRRTGLVCAVVVTSCMFAAIAPARERNAAKAPEDLMLTSNPPGRRGGSFVIALRSEPKTLNPVFASDATSQEVVYCMNADLIHINRETQKTESGLAKSWSITRDGRTYTLELRHGLRFSDGEPFTADDVVFSFQLYLDEKLHSPQRDLLIIGGKPIAVKKLDEYTVQFQLSQPYAAAERLFDGLPILPKHLLEKTYMNGAFSQAWTISMPPAQFAGLGAYRLKEYVPGQQLVLERNPYYWKEDRHGNRLPYLDRIIFLFVPSEDAQIIRFEAGDTDLLSRFAAENFPVLEREAAAHHYHTYNLGPGLEYNFLFFNLNNLSSKRLPEIQKKQRWFRDVRFRQAVSLAMDRSAMVRLVYGGRAAAIWSQVTPGNKLWVDSAIPHPAQSFEQARQLLKSAGFSWKAGSLMDSTGAPVEFSILTSSSNAQRTQMATLIQDDLSHLGIKVHVVSLDFSSMVDRLLNSLDYEAAIMGLASGDTDPTAEMNVWTSSGGTHLWDLGEKTPATPWEAEMDRLMNKQLVTLNYGQRKQLYDRVQEIVAKELPVICLVSPDILVGAKDKVRDFDPAILEPYVLWNVDELYLQ